MTTGLKVLNDEGALPEPLRSAWQVDGLAHREAALAAMVGTLVVLKYGLLAVAVSIAAGFALWMKRLTVLAPWVILACTAKLVTERSSSQVSQNPTAACQSESTLST